MRVDELMTRNPVTQGPEDRLVDAEEQMGLRGFRLIPVVDGDRTLVGIISQVDLVRASLKGDDGDRTAQLVRKARIRVSDLMVKRVDTVAPGDEVGEIARRLRAKRRACFPVVEDGKLVGILTEADFVRMVGFLLPSGAEPEWLGGVRDKLQVRQDES